MAVTGRPTKYDDNMIAMTQNYMENLPEDEVFPSIEGLACYLGVARNTIKDWASQEDKKDFSTIIETLLSMQAKRLMNQGAKGEYNSTVTKLLLTKHGYRDAIDTGFTTPLTIAAGNTEARALAVEYENRLKESLAKPKEIPAPTATVGDGTFDAVDPDKKPENV